MTNSISETANHSSRYNELGRTLRTKLDEAVRNLSSEAYIALGGLEFTATQAIMVETFRLVGAAEGTLWLVDQRQQHLIPVLNTGPRAKEFVGTFRQPLTEGIVSMVLATEKSFLENDVAKNAQHSKKLDQQLRVQTNAMVAVPLFLSQQSRGVISCVQISNPDLVRPTSPGFTPDHLQLLQTSAQTVARLMEYALLRNHLGWEG